jgi:hypothetical protein
MTSMEEQIQATRDHVDHLDASKAKAEQEEAAVRSDVDGAVKRLASVRQSFRCVPAVTRVVTFVFLAVAVAVACRECVESRHRVPPTCHRRNLR